LNCTLAQETRIGARKSNQDRLGYWRTGHSLLMVVADGLGGHLHGEIAAQVAVQHFATSFQREARPMLAAPDAFLSRGMNGAHAAILREAQRRDLSETPRTVIVACVVQEGYAYWTHVGDCRLYLVRRGSIVQRTRDHTVVQQLLEAGRIREEAITTHPDRNRLLQCLGSVQTPRPETVARARLKKDDLILLCSDGLWGPLTQRQLLHALLTRDLRQAIPELADLAEVRAGPQCDNVSLLAMAWGEQEVVSDDEPPTIPVEELPTDVQDFTATDLDFMHMSDEDIEKAINDIKAALRKTSPTQR
jgi:serine/threonine protein phosphatase PrpC